MSTSETPGFIFHQLDCLWKGGYWQK